MTPVQFFWNLGNTVIASIAAFYAFWQVRLLREDKARLVQEEKEAAEWSARANEVVQRLMAFIPRQTPNGPLYRRVIEENDLVGLLQTYLVSYDIGRNYVEARTLTPELLRLPIVRQTIKRLEEKFDTLRRESPDVARLASLL